MELLIAIVCLFIGYFMGRVAAANAVGRLDWDQEAQKRVIEAWGWTATRREQRQ